MCSVQWRGSHGLDSARGGDEGARKSTNNPGAQEVDGECPQGVGGGRTDRAEFNGAIFVSRAVPGPKLWHSEKKVNTESFFVRLVRSAVFDL